MPMPLGLAFQPGVNQPQGYGGGGQPGGAPGQAVSPLQSAIRLISLRLPTVVGAHALAPQALLNAPGGAGQMPGDSAIALLRKLFGMAPGGITGSMAGPSGGGGGDERGGGGGGADLLRMLMGGGPSAAPSGFGPSPLPRFTPGDLSPGHFENGEWNPGEFPRGTGAIGGPIFAGGEPSGFSDRTGQQGRLATGSPEDTEPTFGLLGGGRRNPLFEEKFNFTG